MTINAIQRRGSTAADVVSGSARFELIENVPLLCLRELIQVRALCVLAVDAAERDDVVGHGGGLPARS